MSNDVTCYHNYKGMRLENVYIFCITNIVVGQKNWGDRREHWPDVLYQYEALPRNYEGKKPPPWKYEDRIVLDINRNPVLAFVEIPATISSKLEPCFLEAFTRLNQHILLKDIRARMPRDPTGQGRFEAPSVSVKDPIRLGTLSMSMTRFRERSGMITWGSRAGSNAIKTYMDNLLPAECLARNSIKGFRNLYKHEIAEMHLSNTGAFPEKARKDRDRSSSITKKLKMQNELAAKAQLLREQHEKTAGNSVDSSKVESDASDSEEVAVRDDTDDESKPASNHSSEESDEDWESNENEENDNDAEGDVDWEFVESSQAQSTQSTTDETSVQEPACANMPVQHQTLRTEHINEARAGFTSSYDPPLYTEPNDLELPYRGPHPSSRATSSSPSSACISPQMLMNQPPTSSQESIMLYHRTITRSTSSKYRGGQQAPSQVNCQQFPLTNNNGYLPTGYINQRHFTGSVNEKNTKLLSCAPKQNANLELSLEKDHRLCLEPAQAQFRRLMPHIQLPPYNPNMNYFQNWIVMQSIIGNFWTSAIHETPKLPGFIKNNQTNWSYWSGGHYPNPQVYQLLAARNIGTD